MADSETIEQVEETMEEAEETVKSTELKIDLKVDKKKTEEAMKTLTEAFSGTRKKIESIVKGIKKAMSSLADGVKSSLSDVGKKITDAFTVTSLKEYEAAAERFGEGLAGALFSVHENMKALETSIVDAVAPIAAVVVPIINDAVTAVGGLVSNMGQVIGALFNGAAGADALAQSAATAAGSAEGAANILPVTVNDTLSPQLQAITDRILALVEPLKAIDLSNILTAFSGFQTALAPLTQELFSGLEWAYLNLFVPLAAWTTEGFLPGFLDLVSGAMGVITETISALQPLASWLWENFLQPIAQWTGGVIVDVLQWLADALGAISTWISENQPLVEGIAAVIGAVATAIGLVNLATGIWKVVGAAGVVIGGAFSAAMSGITLPVLAIAAAIAGVIAVVALLIENWDAVKAAVSGAIESVKNVLSDVWQWIKSTVVDPMVNGIKGMVNGVIGFINGLIAGAVKGINGIINMINKLKFTVPDWIPGLGGQTIGFNLKTVSTPQIPYLAQGAVLPANRPFLAVVGDQRHGTNIEAPLATIQEAVALTMEDLAASNLAGHQATVGVLKEILEAVLGIRIGDADIARAADRYRRKMAVVNGTGW